MFDLSPFVTAAILATEAKTWLYAGVKEHVVREGLGIGMVTYYQALNQIIDSELGMQMDPALCRLLRERRDRLQLSRSQRRTA